MTFNEGADIRGGRVSKRGRNTAIGLGGGGLGIIAILLVSQLLGVDLTGIVDPSTLGGGGQEQTEESLERCQTGADANEDIECRMVAAATSLDVYWESQVEGYAQPQLVLFEGSVSTGCGGATSAVGPFYCPPDQTVYIDTSFYAELSARFGASSGELAQIYVVAHEWGHHIQNLIGQMDGLDLRSSGPDSDGVRLELQADCFAGAWVGAATDTTDAQGRRLLDPITDAQLADALSAAEAVGDDNIQESTTGQVQPETWTHGASEQRQDWFLTGMQRGPTACDTFTIPGSEL